MRAILFRGKRSDVVNGNWVYGFYAYIPCGKFSKNEHLIQTIKNNGQIGRLYEVIPETVGQYTGLLDKNGKRIYEGDIVKDEQSGYEYVIKWFSEYACFALANKNGHMEYDVDEFEMLVNDLIVVGNIHDNLELLK